MKQRTIQSTLLTTYSIILITAFLTFSTYFVLQEANRIETQTLSGMSQNAANISTSMDNEVEKLNIVSMNVAYSRLIKASFTDYDAISMSGTKMLEDILTTVIGPNKPVDQINLYTMSDYMFASGVNNGIVEEDVKRYSWYRDVISSKRYLIKFTGRDKFISQFFTDIHGKNFISIFRIYYDLFQTPQGVVEVKKNVRQVCWGAIQYEPLHNEKVYIYDSLGNLIYPVLSEKDYFSLVKGNPSDNMIISQDPSKVFYKEYVFSKYSGFTGFTTVIVVEQSQLLFFNADFLLNTGVLTALMIMLSVALSYIAANRITLPIKRIVREVRTFTLAEERKKINIHTKIIELNSLYDEFHKMQKELFESMNNQLLLQNQEMQSRMLALHSQMNPHFLFNSLSAVQSMADEHMTKEIVAMCQSICNILRYISSDKEQLVDLEQELKHTEDYLNCMSIRYHGDFSYELNIPKEMNCVKVPKLCLQLIVENSIKYATSLRPPWHVSVKGQLNKSGFTLSIADNGPGFDEETITAIHKEIRYIRESGLLPTLEIKGMGLKNIYLRFLLLYPQKIVFNIENILPNGACVTIGVEDES